MTHKLFIGYIVIIGFVSPLAILIAILCIAFHAHAHAR